MIKALVYHGLGQRAWEAEPDPTIEFPTDAIVRIDTITICGTDLRILKGDVPECKPGTTLGHEVVGTIVETGAAVGNFHIGERVLMSCITACGRCRFCKEQLYGQCSGGGGWIFGHLINELQAEYARVPFADTSIYKVPRDRSLAAHRLREQRPGSGGDGEAGPAGHGGGARRRALRGGGGGHPASAGGGVPPEQAAGELLSS